MKNRFTLKMIMFCMLTAVVFAQIPAHAQKLSKQDEDKYKTLAKQYKKNPAMLASLMEKYNEYKDKNTELKEKVNLLESSGTRKSERINDLEVEKNAIQSQLAQFQAKQQAPPVVQEVPPMTTDAWDEGVVFKVQIAAFKDKQLPGEWDTPDGLDFESEANMQKIVVGQFRNYNAASEMSNRLKSLGIKGAWVVSYKDGNRVPIMQATN